MASPEPCPEREALSAMRSIAPVHALKKETANEELLYEYLVVIHKHLMETTHQLGFKEGAAEDDAQTISTLEGRIDAFKAKLLAEQDVNSSLQKKVSHEQQARRSDAKKASDKMEAAKPYIERLLDDLSAEKQRSEKLKQACQEKDNAINAAELRQSRSDFQLTTARSKLGEATRCIEQLRVELKSQQDKLQAAESQVQILEHKLETAEKALEALEVKFNTFQKQTAETTEELRTEFEAKIEANRTQTKQELRAELMQDFKAQMVDSFVTKQKYADLKQELATEQEAKAVVLKDLKASKKAEKAAREEAQQRQQELKQQANSIAAAVNASEQSASNLEKLKKDLASARKHNKVSEEQHKSDLEDLQSELTTAESRNQNLEGQLKTAKNEASGFEEKYRKAVTDASSSGTVLAALEREISTQEDRVLALSKEKTATEQRCAKLELDIKAIEAEKQQQEDANSELAAEHTEQLKHNTQHANEQREFVQRSLQSQQEQIDEVKSQNQTLRDELKVCRRKLGLAVQNYDTLLEETEKQRKESLVQHNGLVQETMDLFQEQQDHWEKRFKDAEKHRASASTAEPLEAGEFDDEGDQRAEELTEDGELGNSENDVSDRVQRHDSGIDDESDVAPAQSKKREQKKGRDGKARKDVVSGQEQLDHALQSQDGSTEGENFEAFVRSQLSTAQKSTRPMHSRTVGSIEPTGQQPDTNTASRIQKPLTAGPPHQQAHGQNIRQPQVPAEVFQAAQQPASAPSLQPTRQVATANGPQPAPKTIQSPQQQFQGLSESKWQHQPDSPAQPRQQQFQGLSESKWHNQPDLPAQPRPMRRNMKRDSRRQQQGLFNVSMPQYFGSGRGGEGSGMGGRGMQ
jgi:predicted  nucleic acid-binding Zn-ribbon protein